MTIEEALNTDDINETIDSMTAYAYSLVKSIDLKDLKGMEPSDFVAEVLMKVVEGKRDWTKAKCSFKEFLFGSLKSHIHNFFTALEQVHESELPNIEASKESADILELKNITIQILKDQGANDEEIDIFECWNENIFKPSEIAGLLERDVKDIYNIVKRLERRMPRIQTEIIKLV
jgi:hypothetical protein